MDDRTSTRSCSTRTSLRMGAAFALALPLAYGGTLWMQLLHHFEGAHDAAGSAFLAQWLRDSTLVLPSVFVAVLIGTLVIRRLSTRAQLPSGAKQALLAGTAALSVAVVFSLAAPLHAILMPSNHAGPELSFAVHAIRDATLSLVATLPLAALSVLLQAKPRLRRATTYVATRAAIVAAVVAPVGVVLVQGVESATAGIGEGMPCPTDAPVKSFNVQAIDVDIPLNKFGDHDSAGKMFVLAENLAAVREQEASQQVSVGLGDDAIQPLVIRANLGDCVEINFANQATGGEYGMHIDGLAHSAASSGDAVGENAPSAVVQGSSRSYRYYVPADPELEGTHYIRPGPGYRDAVSHGLFGALAVEPAGSVYLHPDTRQPIRSGWEAIISPANNKSFREFVRILHEVGDEAYHIPDGAGGTVPVVDPVTEAYRPSSRAINYRSEPFMYRLQNANKKSLAYNSYTFGDPATPIMRAYVGDPTKIRLMHGGSEMFHVYHLHGGGIRWAQNPHADASWDYAKTGLNKSPATGGTNRLDSQSLGPGESFSLEIEGGAGGVQQAVGDLLEHCHLAEHYVAGMWSLWRIFNTNQVDLKALPDRPALPDPVDSTQLLGKVMPDGTTITGANIGQWLDKLLPPKGVPRDDEDGSVWDWAIAETSQGQLYLGEPEETLNWPNLHRAVPGHPSGMPGDQFVGNRPKLLFNPKDGRPAYPLMRPNIGHRAPQAPNGHSGTPFLGGQVNKAASGGPDPFAGRPDGLCPQGAPTRTFNITTIELPIQVTRNGQTDQTGKIFVLNKDKAAVLAGTKPAEPLAIRTNIGDCVAVTLSTELKPDAVNPLTPLPQSNLHIHHVQFDPQGSDGASAGMVFDQSIRPYQSVDPALTARADVGDTMLRLASVAKFQVGVYIAVGIATESIEIHRIKEIDAGANTVTLEAPIRNTHAVGQYAGTEFQQSMWYPDVDLDNVFWHDHVDGIHGWGKGMVGQLIVEPKGSTYHDPVTGEQVDSGTIVDIRTQNALYPGLVDKSFREMALWTIDDNPTTDSTLNLRAEPWADRFQTDGDPSLLFSSYRHGDPFTPLPRAYRGDPFVVRTINVSGNAMDSLHLSGHRFYTESRLRDAQGNILSTPQDSLQYGVSQRFTAVLEGGAGGTGKRAGDYLYKNGIGRRFRQGAWGLLRVLPNLRAGATGLQPLPEADRQPPAGGPAAPQPMNGRPPALSSPGNPCPAAAPRRQFAVSAVDLPAATAIPGAESAFVPTADAPAVTAGTKTPEPLVLHATAGECVEVRFTNSRTPAPTGGGLPRASFNVSKVAQTVESSGVNAGFNPEQTVSPGQERFYRFFMDSPKIGSATIADFGGNDTGVAGLYGALVVAPAGSTFTDPVTGEPRDTGAQIDVTTRDGAYRDFTLVFAENDPAIGANTMPYPAAVAGPALVNYRSAPRPDDAGTFSTNVNGDPTTPLLRAYPGDPMKVHVIGAPGGEQPHSFSLGGLNWHVDAGIPHSNVVSAASFLPWAGIDVEVLGGAGGQGKTVGDFWYGDLRRPFVQAGMWGLTRVLPTDRCEIKPLAGRACGVTTPPPAPEPFVTPVPTPTQTAAPAATPTPTSRPAAPVGGRIRNLVTRGRLSLDNVRRKGISFWVQTPRETRAVMTRLNVQDSSGRLRPVATLRFTTRKGGIVRRVWRLPKGVARRLAAGSYVLTVQAGPAPTLLRSDEARRTIVVRTGLAR